MPENHLSIKHLLVRYLCLYAMLYPLVAHFCMSFGGRSGLGSVPLQIFQGITLLTFVALGRWNHKFKIYVFDFWYQASIYLALISLGLAFFIADNEIAIEVVYVVRIISWFLYASLVTRGVFSRKDIEALSRSFLLGVLFQGLLGIWAFKTQSVASIYKEVYATTGGAFVSGKMIVSFLALGAFFSIYKIFAKDRLKLFHLVIIGSSFLVILFSYNRSAQLGLFLVLLYTIKWLIENRRFKSLYLVVLLTFFLICYLTSTLGEGFLLRWQNIQEDGGSGRTKLVAAVVHHFKDSSSIQSLLFGIGYCQTKSLMYQACGSYIGTHSDLLDLTMCYGIIGGFLYIITIYKIWRLNRLLPSNCLEYYFIRISTLFIISMGLVTGLFQGTYTFIMLFTFCSYLMIKRIDNVSYERMFFLNRRSPVELNLPVGCVPYTVSPKDQRHNSPADEYSGTAASKDIISQQDPESLSIEQEGDQWSPAKKIQNSIIDQAWNEGITIPRE